MRTKLVFFLVSSIISIAVISTIAIGTTLETGKCTELLKEAIKDIENKMNDAALGKLLKIISNCEDISTVTKAQFHLGRVCMIKWLTKGPDEQCGEQPCLNSAIAAVENYLTSNTEKNEKFVAIAKQSLKFLASQGYYAGSVHKE